MCTFGWSADWEDRIWQVWVHIWHTNGPTLEHTDTSHLATLELTYRHTRLLEGLDLGIFGTRAMSHYHATSLVPHSQIKTKQSL